MEYGMMLSFHKHVIPMQREDEALAFNIYPLDTVKYRPDNFRAKAESAIDDAILRYTTMEPTGRPVGVASEATKYFGFRGYRYSDVANEDTAAVYRLGANFGFNLFDGSDGVVFFGYFHEHDPVDIVVNTRFLVNNLALSHTRITDPKQSGSYTAEQRQAAIELLDSTSITLLCPEEAPIDAMRERIEEHMAGSWRVPLTLIRPSELSKIVEDEYRKIALPAPSVVQL
jgi:hypothetical protein